jgi:hypothetical protein
LLCIACCLAVLLVGYGLQKERKGIKSLFVLIVSSYIIIWRFTGSAHYMACSCARLV